MKAKYPKLRDWMEKRLSERGEHSRMSYRLEIAHSTISQWRQGKHPPDLWSCVRVANYFGVDPREIFAVIERKDYAELWDKFIPSHDEKTLPMEYQDYIDILRIFAEEPAMSDLVKMSFGMLTQSYQQITGREVVGIDAFLKEANKN